MQVSDTGTHRQTAQGTLTLPEHYTREEQAHMYVCMYVYTCEDSAINYVEIDVGILVL